MKCPNCGSNIKYEVKFCEYCGTEIKYKTKVADPKKVHVTIREADGDVITINAYDGDTIHINEADKTSAAPIYADYSSSNNVPHYNNQNIDAPQKSKSTAAVLCAFGFIGLAGFHKFYTGKPISGILYLLTYGWFFIGTIIDFVMILNGTYTDNYERPLV